MRFLEEMHMRGLSPSWCTTVLLGFRSRRSTSAISAGWKVRESPPDSMCARPRRCCRLWHLSLYEELHNPEVDDEVWLHHPRSSGTLTAFILWGYVTETLSITTLLLDISGQSEYASYKNYCFCYELHRWYQSRSMCSYAYAIRTLNVDIEFEPIRYQKLLV
jgi:hypothetical protein